MWQSNNIITPHFYKTEMFTFGTFFRQKKIKDQKLIVKYQGVCVIIFLCDLDLLKPALFLLGRSILMLTQTLTKQSKMHEYYSEKSI